jgi:hypothetical protein
MDGIHSEETNGKYEALLGVSVQFNLKWHMTIEDLKD